MSTKTSQLQIRISPEQKDRLKALAAQADRDVSQYVLGRVFPARSGRLQDILHTLERKADCRFELAELNDFLSDLGPSEFTASVESVDLVELSPFARNYVCALAEQAARIRGLTPPAWTKAVEPLAEPYFAAPLLSLRPHLLRVSPVPFRRRQLFVDSALGDRV